MKAIVDINGKQYEVEEGRYVRIDSYDASESQDVVLGNVCLVIAGGESLVGAPYVEGATVKAQVKRHGRGPKVLVYKMRCKKGYRRKNGHRQGFTELQVVSIDFAGREKFGPVPEAQKPAERPAKKQVEEAPKAKKAPKAAVEAPAKEEKKAEAKPKAKKAATGEAKAAAPKKAAPKKAKEEAPKAEDAQAPVEAATQPATTEETPEAEA